MEIDGDGAVGVEVGEEGACEGGCDGVLEFLYSPMLDISKVF